MNEFLEFLTNPNVTYLLLWAGITMAMLAVLSPGTGILEIGALICLGLAGTAIFNIDSINYWSIGIIALGAIFFLLAVRYQKQWIFLVVAIACLVIGSIFLFPTGEHWYEPAVNPFLALVVSGLSALFFWFLTRKVLEARSVLPTHDLQGLIGEIGEAKTEIYRDGSVQVGSELWSATSEEPIASGTEVKIVGREGFTLIVEGVNDKNES